MRREKQLLFGRKSLDDGCFFGMRGKREKVGLFVSVEEKIKNTII